jgi:hypothetical protein
MLYGYFVAFPLILTFSRREKEQQLDILPLAKIIRAACRLQFAKTLRAFPPRPAGEGRGEGEHFTQPMFKTLSKSPFYPAIELPAMKPVVHAA